MADQHGKGNGKVVRGRDERPPQSEDTLVDEDSTTGPGDDLAGIRADDALLDALGGRDGDQPESLVDDELNALLLAWRREVDSPPVGELVDTDTAVATIAAARPQARGRHRFLIPLASAAAVLAIAFTGMSLVARDAEPGDALWGLTRVLYSEHARSVEAAVAVRDDLDTARVALREGRYGEARDALLKAGASLPSVSPDDGKDDLTQTHESLLEELTSTTPSPSTSPTAGPTTTPAVPTTTTDNRPSPETSTTPEPATTTVPTTTTEQPAPTTDGPAAPPPPTSGESPAGGQTRDESQTPGATDGSQSAPEN
ncbi:anti-sigma-D factor RsdA [Actinosynnema sp. NPDC023658]|uniref:anti-sigma-D factor RsdA n=1 Tax=Actinosynnema sp. NPDC023658 TaxID=3155465 RepID=UPI0033D129C4